MLEIVRNDVRIKTIIVRSECFRIEAISFFEELMIHKTEF